MRLDPASPLDEKKKMVKRYVWKKLPKILKYKNHFLVVCGKSNDGYVCTKNPDLPNSNIYLLIIVFVINVEIHMV